MTIDAPDQSPLLRIRSMRDRMSAIERRIADYILENFHFLRDYSSQQLADALGVSQSSVVKFSQKLGYKGYPDLKYSIGEAIAREGRDAAAVTAPPRGAGATSAAAEALWRAKTHAEEETRLLNPADRMLALAATLHGARRVFVIGLGEDGLAAAAFAARLTLAGVAAIHHGDAARMAAATLGAEGRDALVVFSEQGRHPPLVHLAAAFRAGGGHVVSVTRHSANPLRAHANDALLVSAHDDRAHVEPLLYASALQHLLDVLFVLVCETGKGRLATYHANLGRIEALHGD